MLDANEKKSIIAAIKNDCLRHEHVSDVETNENKISLGISFKFYNLISIEIKVRKNGPVGTIKSSMLFNLPDDTDRQGVTDGIIKSLNDDNYMTIIQPENDSLIIQKAISFEEIPEKGKEVSYMKDTVDTLLKVIEENIEDFAHEDTVPGNDNDEKKIIAEKTMETKVIVTEKSEENDKDDSLRKTEENNDKEDSDENDTYDDDIEAELRQIQEEEAAAKNIGSMLSNSKKVSMPKTEKIYDKNNLPLEDTIASAPVRKDKNSVISNNTMEKKKETLDVSSKTPGKNKYSDVSSGHNMIHEHTPANNLPVSSEKMSSGKDTSPVTSAAVNSNSAVPLSVREQIDAAYEELDKIMTERNAQLEEREKNLNRYADSVRKQESIAQNRVKTAEGEYIKKTVLLEDEYDEKKKSLEEEYIKKSILLENDTEKKNANLEKEYAAKQADLEAKYQLRLSSLEAEYANKENELVSKCAEREAICDNREAELNEKANSIFSEIKKMEFDKKKIAIEKETLRARENGFKEKMELLGKDEKTSADPKLQEEIEKLRADNDRLVMECEKHSEELAGYTRKITELEEQIEKSGDVPADSSEAEFTAERLKRLEKVYAKKDKLIDKLKAKLDRQNEEIERLKNTAGNEDPVPVSKTDTDDKVKERVLALEEEVSKNGRIISDNEATISDLKHQLAVSMEQSAKMKEDLEVAMTALDEKVAIIKEKDEKIAKLEEMPANSGAEGESYVYGMETEQEDLKTKADRIKQELRKVGLETDVLPSSGAFILSGERDGCVINIDLENGIMYCEKAVKKAAKYLRRTEEWTQENIRVSYTVNSGNNKVICKYFYGDPTTAVVDVLEKMGTVE